MNPSHHHNRASNSDRAHNQHMALAPSDPYAKRLAAWRVDDLSSWQRDFAAWDGKDKFRYPPKPPKVGKAYETQDAEQTEQRGAAYRLAKAECDEWHTKWQAKNGDRKTGDRAQRDAQRDWAAEEDEREKEREREEEESKPVRPSQAMGMHPLVLAQLESRCTAEEGECDCVLCEGKRVAVEEQRQLWNNEVAAMSRAAQARAAQTAELEDRIAVLETLPSAELASLPQPSHAELQVAAEFVERNAHPPRKVSPHALLEVRRQREVRAAVESLISTLEKQARHAKMEPMQREDEQERELVLWLVEEICRPGRRRPVWCASEYLHQNEDGTWSRRVRTDRELAARWRAEVEAVAGDEYWPDDFQLQGITYLRYCVPRQIATPQPWPQVWMLGADGEWQHETGSISGAMAQSGQRNGGRSSSWSGISRGWRSSDMQCSRLPPQATAHLPSRCGSPRARRGCSRGGARIGTSIGSRRRITRASARCG